MKAPVAVAPRYDGLPLAGAAKAFDDQLDSWLTRALELGMIGSGLGQIFPLNLEKRRAAGRSNVDYLLLVGMGVPGHFAADDLRYLMSNVAVAVKNLTLGTDTHLMSTMLIGTRRNELTIDQAVRGMLNGFRDGYERYRAIADMVKDKRELFQRAAEEKLLVSLVESDHRRASLIIKSLKEARNLFPELEDLGGDEPAEVKGDSGSQPTASDLEPPIEVTLLRVTQTTTANAGGAAAGGVAAAAPATGTIPPTDTFQFSALTDTAAVAVREIEVNPFFVRELPNRMRDGSDRTRQEDFCLFFNNYLIHDDLREFIEEDKPLTLIVDETTAGLPWEMTTYWKHNQKKVVGINKPVSRLFRSLLSPPPRSLPALNEVLNVLVIANPASGRLSLPGAREEGLAVIDVLNRARKAWQGRYRFEVDVRIGSFRDLEEDPCLDKIRQLGAWITSVAPCDPVELAKLIVNNHYDVIHYAGHGLFDRQTGRAGWCFDRDCFLTAREIFRVRQVPRLVFANACFSAETAQVADNSHRQLVGLAQAFFARGIPNYVGTGWKIDDDRARDCARWFYARILNLKAHDSEQIVDSATAPPATIGNALLDARQRAFATLDSSSTWGAYQHYGHIGDKLLPFRNVENNSEE